MSGDHTIRARWRRWEGLGLEHLVLQEGPLGIVAEAAVIGGDAEEDFAMTYRIACGPDWEVRTLEARIVGMACSIQIASDGLGLDDGRRVATSGPGRCDRRRHHGDSFTNTLPIRRLRLDEGQSAEITVAYVSVPDLALSASRQRYTCLKSGSLYRFESVESGFSRDIAIDRLGLVVEYPDLFRRVADA